MDPISLLVLQAVRARNEYNEALQELAVAATGTTLLKIEVRNRIEEIAVDDNTSAFDLQAVARLAEGNCH